MDIPCRESNLEFSVVTVFTELPQFLRMLTVDNNQQAADHTVGIAVKRLVTKAVYVVSSMQKPMNGVYSELTVKRSSIKMIVI